MADIGEVLRDRLAAAFGTVTGSTLDPVLRRSRHADFQADGALGQPGARAVAAAVVEAVDLADLCSDVTVVGPGFINLTLSDAALAEWLAAAAADDRLGVSTVEPETVVVDYSGPNAAKEMHVGHLRSTVIGDAAVRVLEYLGHTVIRQNHLGDWGTNFGMLVEHLADGGELDFATLYTAARRKFEADPAFQERARRRVVLLQTGDPQTIALWRSIVQTSKSYFQGLYDQLGVRLQDGDFAGESGYNDALDGVVDDLLALGLLRESDGALCAFPEGFTTRDGAPLPLIVRKRDGGYGYAATDLAALRYRIDELKATRLLYVVGAPQRQHLEMVFAVARAAGWLAPPVRAEHVAFGSVLGADGKMLRSRTGGAVKLTELLTEAVERAGGATIGIGALKYADLSSDRIKGYTFDYDRMLATNGDTAPYLQYAHVRVASIFRRGGIDGADGEFVIAHPAEHALALELLAFPGAVARAGETLELHRLTAHLHDVAVAFTAFFEQCQVLRAPEPVRAGRLALCRLTARVLATGLDLLGIEAPERM
ncbi:arginine--tRNA ligase [Dactylosporangium vinaceum]|uniref:Arginine--tRNA ligase n=1 Tax=Dactylosporangium vinaceum TaxID=53362 RepID=A0ABV5M4D1_9ACTN|nr:arginine--tRNA ligase [Dactylosporangium vinaceum]UAB96199.1 arginine--tRNA ligase [Dactylosporangium vinaceum]